MIDGSLWARSVAIPLHWEASKDEQLLLPGTKESKNYAELFFLASKEKSPKKANSCSEKKKERNSNSQISATCEFSYRNVVTVQNCIVRLVLKTRK